MELQALPSRIGQVRRIVSAQLRYWHMDPLIDRAALGVTELLSNVHRHARPDKSCTVELELLPDRLTVSVRDHDPRLPVLTDAADVPDAGPLATCGRGLAMVAAMSESWGARPVGEDGKVVWFTLPATSLQAPARVSYAPHRAPTRRPTQVPAAAPVGDTVGAGTAVDLVVPLDAGAPVGGGTPVGAGAPGRAAAPVGATAPLGAGALAHAGAAGGRTRGPA